MAKRLAFTGEVPAPDDEVERVEFRNRMKPVFEKAAAIITEATGHHFEFSTLVYRPRKSRKAA